MQAKGKSNKIYGLVFHKHKEIGEVPLSHAEIDEVVASSMSNSSPGPEGFSIPFFKKFWDVLKHLVYAIIQGSCLGTVDISRLNYAVISLIRKVKQVDCIRFRIQ